MTSSVSIVNREQAVLDHGLIKVIDCMGDDASIVRAARVSYGQDTTTSSTARSNQDLIRYLLRNRHTTPFEMCEIKLFLRMPLFVARQWMRHRTASVNEVSARYTVLSEQWYVPTVSEICTQSETNHQGRGGQLDESTSLDIQRAINENCQNSYACYTELLKKGTARELARTVLPLGTYTQFYWKIDLHNLLHFLELRTAPNAQYEIRVYAEAIQDMIADWVPHTYKAFMDYRRGAFTLSRAMIEQGCLQMPRDVSALGKRELAELKAAMLGFSTDV